MAGWDTGGPGSGSFISSTGGCPPVFRSSGLSVLPVISKPALVAGSSRLALWPRHEKRMVSPSAAMMWPASMPLKPSAARARTSSAIAARRGEDVPDNAC